MQTQKLQTPSNKAKYSNSTLVPNSQKPYQQPPVPPAIIQSEQKTNSNYKGYYSEAKSKPFQELSPTSRYKAMRSRNPKGQNSLE